MSMESGQSGIVSLCLPVDPDVPLHMCAALSAAASRDVNKPLLQLFLLASTRKSGYLLCSTHMQTPNVCVCLCFAPHGGGGGGLPERPQKTPQIHDAQKHTQTYAGYHHRHGPRHV